MHNAGPKPRVVRSASSLKALSSAVLLDHVDLFRGLDNPSSHVELPPQVLKKLLSIVTTVRRISDENLPFFLTEHYRELAIDVRGSPGALTDASLSLIPVCCPDLNELAFKNCSALSRGGVDALCKNACVGLANSLTSLSFVACPGMYVHDQFMCISPLLLRLSRDGLAHCNLPRSPSTARCALRNVLF